jgi:hypothetical protein
MTASSAAMLGDKGFSLREVQVGRTAAFGDAILGN